ncbi:hypothetical protein CPB97_012088 [Podila verticillata]|nr:hypothetical protein CPB97_012088 [Podila verticillata]
MGKDGVRAPAGLTGQYPWTLISAFPAPWTTPDQFMSNGRFGRRMFARKTVNMMVYYPPLYHENRPSVGSGQFNETGGFDSNHYTNVEAFNIQYGDGQLFVFMKMGQGIQLEMTNPDNVTLAYMPFTAPLNSTSAKLQITKASKTNVTQGPYRLKGSFYSDLSLVYGPNAEVSGPRFGILTQPGCHMAFDLRSVNSNSTLTTFQVPNNAVAAGNLKEYEFLIPCDGFCTALQSTELLSVGVGEKTSNGTVVPEDLKTPSPQPDKEFCASESCTKAKTMRELIIIGAVTLDPSQVYVLFLA